MGRKIAREEAMKLLFQMEINNNFSNSIVEEYLEEKKPKNRESEYISDIISKAIQNKEYIDSVIEKHSKSWKLNRIAKVDLSVLRIAICEINYRSDIPLEVSINEALEISKTYSNLESAKFINGVLGSYVKRLDEKDE
ncbi:transcription antitermination factor NusB [Caldisalinibacter kiritimatiensis]|uniref:Transcription antitermination protein NusB n=1 Tax=Caldisalinibacter kiritimatiensis TaxID=1304284 RepID=R1CHF9_9FIRM|nr:transcription antitermination factor NusB [Caldisalinibacter kiritimatiensis]EOD01730.1 Transcription termination protein NusB [Caldisalinibacter kiritimatiensis]